MTQNSDGHFNLSSDTTKPFQPNPLSSDSAISTRHSNGTDAARTHNHASFPPEADDTISDTGTSAAPHAAKNTADEAKHETRPEETRKKKDSGSASGRDPDTINEESTTILEEDSHSSVILRLAETLKQGKEVLTLR